jgi:HEPN domain-containing protein
MNDQDKFEFLLDSPQYDLAAADILFRSERWPYVAFTCQQAIEKIVKGLYILYIDDNIPKINNIICL